jgi:hypothetical protein
MVHEEKLKKVCNDFSLLSDNQQDYILGILQALVYAKGSYENKLPGDQPETDNLKLPPDSNSG